MPLVPPPVVKAEELLLLGESLALVEPEAQPGVGLLVLVAEQVAVLAEPQVEQAALVGLAEAAPAEEVGGADAEASPPCMVGPSFCYVNVCTESARWLRHGLKRIRSRLCGIGACTLGPVVVENLGRGHNDVP